MPLFLDLYKTTLPEDVKALDDLISLSDHHRDAYARSLALTNQRLDQVTYVKLAPLDRAIAAMYSKFTKIALPSVRTAKQFYPIAPCELKEFFLEDNLDLLAEDAQEASRTKTIRNNEVRRYLRHMLETAYYAMCYSTQRAPGVLPPLADHDFMNELLETIHERDFDSATAGRASSKIQALYNKLLSVLMCSRKNIKNKPIAALCWAIAVDAALLDASLK